MGKMHETITPRQLCERTGTDPDTMRARFTKLHKTNPALFPERWRIDGELNEAQEVALLSAGERKGSAPKKEISAATFAAPVAMTTEQGRPNVVAPQGMESKKTKWGEVTALGIAFVLPTLASAFNTYNVSHQLSKNEWVALFVMGMVMLTPVLFIAARMDWTGVVVAFGVVIFEGFCNASATYLALMGQMEYILDDKRGQCSDFLQSVVNLTSSDHRPTAVLLGAILSVIIAATQLTAFWGIRKRI